MKIIKTIS